MKALYFILLILSLPVQAHHVLGRPAYSLNEDSNTPPSMQVETQIGDYHVTYMVFPAFPRAGERGRINVYATRIDDGKAFQGEITFRVRDDGWFSQRQEEFLGAQQADDNVFRQGFEFSENGDYLITAAFTANGEPYRIDFPLRIGPPPALGPIGITVVSITVVLITVNLLQRRKLLRSRIANAHEESRSTT